MRELHARRYLYEHARIPAWKFEHYIGKWTNFVPGNRSLAELVKSGSPAKDFAESDDPNRMVPIVQSADDFMVAVSGDPLRTNAYTFSHNGMLGYTVGKKITLPPNWDELLRHAAED